VTSGGKKKKFEGKGGKTGPSPKKRGEAKRVCFICRMRREVVHRKGGGGGKEVGALVMGGKRKEKKTFKIVVEK